MTAADLAAVADYEAQAREFLHKGRQYLAAGDLHQASKKGWGAAAHMAKAVAVAQGWEYGTHADFSAVLNRATEATGDDRLRASPTICTATTTVAADTSMRRSSARISKAWRNCWSCSAHWPTSRAESRCGGPNALSVCDSSRWTGGARCFEHYQEALPSRARRSRASEPPDTDVAVRVPPDGPNLTVGSTTFELLLAL